MVSEVLHGAWCMVDRAQSRNCIIRSCIDRVGVHVRHRSMPMNAHSSQSCGAFGKVARQGRSVWLWSLSDR